MRTMNLHGIKSCTVGVRTSSCRTQRRAPAAVLGEELLALRDIKNESDAGPVARLSHLIQEHYLAVGNLAGEAFKCRNIQIVHQFLMTFHDAMSNHEFKIDTSRSTCTRHDPKSSRIFRHLLRDGRGTSTRTTALVAHTSGNRNSAVRVNLIPVRKHRGRWAPHQEWGKEWYDVVCRRAEALWYRSVGPTFGAPQHPAPSRGVDERT